MGLAAKLDKFIPDLSATLARFPVPAAVAVALCVYFNIVAAGSFNDETGLVAAGGAAAFIASGAAHLLAEGNRWSRMAGILLALASGAALALVGYFTAVFETSLLFLFAGLIPVLMIAPYLRTGVKQAALWLFNLRFGLAVLLAFIVALVFSAGLSSIVEALNFLFEAGIGGNLHEHIWGTAATLIGPLYGLSLMPRDLDAEVDIASQKDTLLERGVSVLVNYVLVPVIIVYALILHAYAVKILLDGQLPKGQIATMVSIFAVGGTGAWLVAWPWRDTGTRLLRLFMRGWFFFTIVPAVLLTIAIWRRIGDYGVTPDRYGIALVAIWVAFITAYLAFRRNRADMRAILGGIAILLLVGSAGPFGANGLTIKTQLVRFAELLAANGLMKDGKVVPQKQRVPQEIVTEGYSILGTLRDAGGLGRLRPWFESGEKNPFKPGDSDWSAFSAITAYLGFDNPQLTEDYVNFTANVPLSAPVDGKSRLVGPLQAMQNYRKSEPQPPMTALFDDTDLTIKLEAKTYIVGEADLLAKIKALTETDGTQPAVKVEIAPGVTMLIDSAYGNLANKPPLGSMRFWLLIRDEGI